MAHNESSESKDSSAEATFIETARDRFKISISAFSDIKSKALADLKFYNGDQWDETAKRERSGRPCLVINKIPQFVRQVTNEERQNRPSIKISPVDSLGDPKVAEIYQGIIRNIEIQSNAAAAYDTSFLHCVQTGLGYWRLRTEYIDKNSFDQRIVIERILNPFNVTLDPSCDEPDYSDMKYAFVTEDMTYDEFRANYPGRALTGLDDYRSIGDSVRDWATDGTVKVAEYYSVKMKKHTLVEAVYPGGQSIVARKDIFEKLEAPEGLEWEILKEREVEEPTVTVSMINGIEVLEQTEWPIEWIPIVPCIGDEMIVDGKRVIKGMIRDAIDSQKMNNYMASKETEAIAQMPIVPYIGYGDSFKGYEREWRDAATTPKAFLRVNHKTHQGKPLPIPTRSAFDPNVQALSMARQQASNDMESIVGVFSSSLGRRERADSGKAINALQQSSDTANFHYVDNLSRAIRHTGKILVALIPHIYDTDRIERIIGVDDTERQVRIVNEPGAEAIQQGEPNERGEIEKIYNVGVGRYDVIVETGPSYATKRQESVAALMDLVKYVPELGVQAPDLLIKNIDSPVAEELTERVKKFLPPEVFQDDDDQQMPPQAQQQIQQMQQQLEGMQGQLQEAQAQVASKKEESESRERIAEQKVSSEQQIAQMKLQFSAQEAQMKQQIEMMKLEIEKAKIEAGIEIKSREIESDEKIAGAELSLKDNIANRPRPQ
jgi:hypothetical protein